MAKCKWCKYNEAGDCANNKSDHYKEDCRDVRGGGCDDGVD